MFYLISCLLFQAVIVGSESRKILFIGVRNKYCIVCARAYNNNIEPKPHTCFRNWSGSSSAMEADIVVEGFCLAEQVHKVRYKYFIADGDSSVYARIVQRVPYGREVHKLECMNHATKNYGKALHKIRSDTKVNVEVRKWLTVSNIKKLQNIAQKSIYHCETSHELKEHLKIGPLHVFGNHNHCKDYFCDKIGSIQNSTEIALQKSGCSNYVYGNNTEYQLCRIMNNE